MKYWWLEKYKNIKVVDIDNLKKDVNYFIIIPKNYQKQLEIINAKKIEELEEEELLILLKNLVNTKKIKDNTLIKIIEKLLLIPDNSFPKSDYNLIEMLEEIKNLKQNKPYQEKINNNNIAICYHCLNIFYVDKIKKVNKNNYCLCPYCNSTKLYFDNDYIPMNYLFLKLAYMYHNVSKLGCSFAEIKQLLKKSIIIKKESIIEDVINLDFLENKLSLIEEKKAYKKIIDSIQNEENKQKYEIKINVKKIQKDNILLLFISLIEVLINDFYIKKIIINFVENSAEKKFKKYLKNIIKNS